MKYIYLYNLFTVESFVNKAGLKSEFSFIETNCHSKDKESKFPNYLPVTEARIGTLIQIEMQTVFSRI